MAKSILYKLDLAKRTSIGVMAADFEAKTPEQIPIKLSSFKGQYVLIDFWASWCGPCRQENPNVLRAYETFKDKNFTVLGVSIDEKEDAWVKAVKQDGLVWVQLLDRTAEIAKMYGINAIPKNFLVDPSGKIIAKNLRGSELMSTLQEVLGKKK
jgi:peroxiredoxin